jgi:hypothetical protein
MRARIRPTKRAKARHGSVVPPKACVEDRVKYQLVAQFQATSMDDFDQLVTFEDKLAETLEGFAIVDGHDFGSGTFNIFVHTDEPSATFQRIQEFVRIQQKPYPMRVAYRDFSSDDYTILWPPDLKEFKVI